ncbi:hypothetical protein NLI96_g4702 [Meripilus lineatus]|uniref:NAD(P)-binding protein n=1 Tax=Meripilus lineatus TaxID=2056292 RepID=A0AAD5V6C8_9APHY|nr:hypothetical protein NLI96_g4702 [Physisporinus lineatus]
MGAGFSRFLTLFDQNYPPKSKFATSHIHDLSGRVVIVTEPEGGNSGVGKETIKVLLLHNAKVYMASRSKSRAAEAIQELKTATGKQAHFLELDLSSLESIRKAAQEFMRGLMWPPKEQITSDGYDLQFGTNVIGHFYFTELLMPALLAGKETSLDGHARVVTTSSSGAYFHTLKWDTFVDGPARLQMSTQDLYYQSKFANVVVARQVAKRYGDQGILSVSVNPGVLRTDLQRYIPNWQRPFMYVLLHPAWKGALTQLYAGTMPEALNHNGEFFIPWARVGRCRDEAYDDGIGERLWDWLQDQVKSNDQSPIPQ